MGGGSLNTCFFRSLFFEFNSAEITKLIYSIFADHKNKSGKQDVI